MLHILQLTEELYSLVFRDVKEAEQEDYIASIHKLLDLREEEMKRLPNNFSVEEREIGETIIKLNEKINNRLFLTRNIIGEQANHAKQQLDATQGYNRQYESLGIDGMFYDKKR